MAKKLKYEIVNSTLENYDNEVEVDGEMATVKRQRLHVDAQPVDGGEKAFAFTMPADQADAFPEGALLTVSLSVDASGVPASPETPVEEA